MYTYPSNLLIASGGLCNKDRLSKAANAAMRLSKASPSSLARIFFSNSRLSVNGYSFLARVVPQRDLYDTLLAP